MVSLLHRATINNRPNKPICNASDASVTDPEAREDHYIFTAAVAVNQYLRKLGRNKFTGTTMSTD